MSMSASATCELPDAAFAAEPPRVQGEGEAAKAAPRAVHAVAVTGGAGFLGTYVLRALAARPDRPGTIVAFDVRDPRPEDRVEGVLYERIDIRDPQLGARFTAHAIESVIHLAFCVSPKAPREVSYGIDVLGTESLLGACREAGVTHLVTTSSGAAYGYAPECPAWLYEDEPLRASEVFPYAHHKRLVEEMLLAHRVSHPALRQLVLRPGAILGPGTSTPVTEPFEARIVVGVQGAAAPFAFVWVEDVAAVIGKGALERKEGIYNVVGDGVVTLREVAHLLGKRYLPLPARLTQRALGLLAQLGLTRYGPEHLDFLRYRPTPVNDALKRDFGYTPRLSAREAFERWRAARPA